MLRAAMRLHVFFFFLRHLSPEFHGADAERAGASESTS